MAPAWIVGAALVLLACNETKTAPAPQSPQPAQTVPAQPATAQTVPAQPATAPTEGAMPTPIAPAPAVVPQPERVVVFDPAAPPAGFSRCHRTHCHGANGAVVTYKLVMERIGATELKGGGDAHGSVAVPADVSAPSADAIRHDNGLVSRVLVQGSGPRKAKPNSIVKVHFSGWTSDGKLLDSTEDRGQPAQFPLDRVMPGWRQGIAMMIEGEIRRFWMPQALTFGGKPGQPTGTLVYDIELLAVGR